MITYLTGSLLNEIQAILPTNMTMSASTSWLSLTGTWGPLFLYDVTMMRWFPRRFYRMRPADKQMDEMCPSKDAAPRACTESRLCFVGRQSERPEHRGDEPREYPLALEASR